MPGAGLTVTDAPGFHRFDLPMETPFFSANSPAVGGWAPIVSAERTSP
jgi:hypothetical protein